MRPALFDFVTVSADEVVSPNRPWSLPMFLDHFTLGALSFAAIVLRCGIIAIHQIPVEVTKHRNRSHRYDIPVSGGISPTTSDA